MNTLSIINRTKELFTPDIVTHETQLTGIVNESRFLVIGGAGSIGQAITREIFKRNPRKLHVVDISENNMVELVRDIRSSFGYIAGDFQTFAEIAVNYLKQRGLEPHLCQTEEEARSFFNNLQYHSVTLSNTQSNTVQQKKHQWPCLFTKSNTTGEKDFEEFFTDQETLNMNRFQNLGIIKNELENFDGPIDYFEHSMRSMKERKSWSKQEIVDLFHYMIPGFEHKEVGRYLDSKM